MRKIIYHTKIGLWITLGLPIVMIIIVGIWFKDKWSELNCKK